MLYAFSTVHLPKGGAPDPERRRVALLYGLISPSWPATGAGPAAHSREAANGRAGYGWPWRSHRERVARWFAGLAWHWVAIVVVSLLGLSLFASIGLVVCAERGAYEHMRKPGQRLATGRDEARPALVCFGRSRT